jgi:hypothetical protein
MMLRGVVRGGYGFGDGDGLRPLFQQRADLGDERAQGGGWECHFGV